MVLKIVNRDIPSNKETQFDDQLKQIEIGEGAERITIMATSDGDIRISADCRLVVFPRAANVIHVALVR